LQLESASQQFRTFFYISQSYSLISGKDGWIKAGTVILNRKYNLVILFRERNVHVPGTSVPDDVAECLPGYVIKGFSLLHGKGWLWTGHEFYGQRISLS
jgi:hypothetical protein